MAQQQGIDYADNTPLGVHLRSLKENRDDYIVKLNQNIFPALSQKQAGQVADKILGLTKLPQHVNPGSTGSDERLDGGYVIRHSIKQGLEFRHLPGYETYK